MNRFEDISERTESKEQEQTEAVAEALEATKKMRSRIEELSAGILKKIQNSIEESQRRLKGLREDGVVVSEKDAAKVALANKRLTTAKNYARSAVMAAVYMLSTTGASTNTKSPEPLTGEKPGRIEKTADDSRESTLETDPASVMEEYAENLTSKIDSLGADIGKEISAAGETDEISFPGMRLENPQRDAYENFDAFIHYSERWKTHELQNIQTRTGKALKLFRSLSADVADSKPISVVINELDAYLQNDENVMQATVENRNFPADTQLDTKIHNIKELLSETESQASTLGDLPPDTLQRYTDILQQTILLIESNRKMAITELEHRYGEMQTQDYFEKMAPQVRKAFEKYDEQRMWMANLLFSDAWENRAKGEGLSEEEIAERRQRVLSDEHRISDNAFPLMSKGKGEYVNDMYFGPARQVSGRAMIKAGPLQDADNAQFDRVEDLGVYVHEIQHQMSEGTFDMSQTAKKLYREASLSDKEIAVVTGQISAQEADRLDFLSGEQRKEFGVRYLTSFSELDARKKQLEWELARHDIWDPASGEVFAQEHLEAILELKRKDVLNSGAETFLDVLKNDKISEIMNTLS